MVGAAARAPAATGEVVAAVAFGAVITEVTKESNARTRVTAVGRRFGPAVKLAGCFVVNGIGQT